MTVQIYNNIPVELVGKKVFEVGATNTILESKLRGKALSAQYKGLNVVRVSSQLFIICADILTYEFQAQFDTIIMIEVLEHLELDQWESVIKKLMNALLPGGHLILSTPAHQTVKSYMKCRQNYIDYFERHKVFNISLESLDAFFPTASINKISYLVFNQDKKPLYWAIARFCKRLLYRYPLIRKNWLIVVERNG